MATTAFYYIHCAKNNNNNINKKKLKILPYKLKPCAAMSMNKYKINGCCNAERKKAKNEAAH